LEAALPSIARRPCDDDCDACREERATTRHLITWLIARITTCLPTPVSAAAEGRWLDAEAMRTRSKVKATPRYLHESVRRHNEPVSPPASRIACRSGIVRRRQAELRRSSYHTVASLQSRARSNTAPGAIWRCSHQATMSSSDRKRSIVAQVKPMSRHHS